MDTRALTGAETFLRLLSTMGVERIFAVKVLEVNTVYLKGKRKRARMRDGKRPDQKKAIVTLREGDKIEFFEGL